MSWEPIATGLFASFPDEVEGVARVVVGIKDIVALMREPESEPAVIVTNVAGGSAVSTIIRRAKAIVSTIGGPNSHIVIVARDYRVPCIVGAAGLDPPTLSGARLRLSADGGIAVWREPVAAPPEAQLRLLRNIAFAGAVGEVGEIIGVDADPILLRALHSAGLLDTDGAISPTEAGQKALEAWYRRDRAGIDAAARETMHAQFAPLDRQLKRTATAWQTADNNDDWDGRLSAVEQLSALHADASAYIERHRQNWPRLVEYRERLARALEKVLSGDTAYVAGVKVDSFHTVWFQWHEDLLRLLERTREPE